MKISLNECADLTRLDDGRVVVAFEDHHYDRDAPVPMAILGDNYRLDTPPKVFLASHLVATCMTGKFGRVNQWPTAAAQFVYPKDPPAAPE